MIKKLLVVLCIGILCFAIYQTAFTYALFETNRSTSVNEELATWDITINNSQVTTTNHTFAMNQLHWTNSNHVQTGKVAPGMEGYFDIVIDPGETDVSIRYDITFDFSNIDNTEFVIGQIAELVDNNLVRTGEFVYTGIISLTNIGLHKIHTIRVELAWNNNEANNGADYEMGSVANSTVDIPVTVVTSQYLGEEITAYIEE